MWEGGNWEKKKPKMIHKFQYSEGRMANLKREHLGYRVKMGDGYIFKVFQLIEKRDSCNKPFVLLTFCPVKANCHVLEADDFEVNINKMALFWRIKNYVHTLY